MKKICVVTGTRAEYGLLYWLIKGINDDPELELQLLVTGMHISPEFGLTWKQIEQDGFPISRKIEILLSSDSSIGISKSMALAQISFAEALDQLKPDLLILLGDRTEIFSAASTALIAGIPIAHIHGGEITAGAYDDAIRHSITKMSLLHFTATEEYQQRVIQMGERPETVYNVGAIGLDNIKRLKLLSREEFENSINHKLFSKNLLITFHPVTLDYYSANIQFTQLLKALDELKNTLLIFTKPNSDKGGRIIIQLIDEYVQKNKNKAVSFVSLGQLLYLSAMSHVDAVVGNSSSGIIEAPVLNVPTINIGDRQKGRIMGQTIINCQPSKEKIIDAIHTAFNFDRSIPRKHPYGEGNTSNKILGIIKNIKTLNIKKKFYDIKFKF
jgi:GDP/UDP-N,N'-diacetylbacillosamine 2-epimerase (hydrolysing)